jgi:ribosome maturation factor RimP
MARPVAQVAAQLEDRLATLGFELVEVEWAGSSNRPIIRIRVDRPEGEGPVTVDDCARASRGLEPWLDELGTLPERYVLEVSSPGVDRPLVRSRDFERFAGEDVVVKGGAPLLGRSRRLEGVLLGLAVEGERERIRLRLANGEEVEIPREKVSGAHLVYRWS